jgi:hypothetical protein
MEPGWIVLLFSLFVQMFFTVLASRPRLRLGVWARNSSHPACSPACACTSAAQLVAPLPSNAVRGFLVEAIQSLTEKPGVKYAVWGTFALNIFYFWYSLATVDAAPACSGVSVPPPARRRAPSSTEIAPPHSSLHLRRAQVYDRGADAHGPRPRNPVPSRVRHYVRGQAGHVPSGAQCWLGYPNLHSSMTLTLTQTLILTPPNPNPNPNSNLTLTLTHPNQERNALICGASLFLWFVLRRLVDIQGKLHESRAMHKAAGGAPKGGVPMGMPVGQPAKPLKGE